MRHECMNSWQQQQQQVSFSLAWRCSFVLLCGNDLSAKMGLICTVGSQPPSQLQLQDHHAPHSTHTSYTGIYLSIYLSIWASYPINLISEGGSTRSSQAMHVAAPAAVFNFGGMGGSTGHTAGLVSGWEGHFLLAEYCASCSSGAGLDQFDLGVLGCYLDGHDIVHFNAGSWLCLALPCLTLCLAQGGNRMNLVHPRHSHTALPHRRLHPVAIISLHQSLSLCLTWHCDACLTSLSPYLHSVLFPF